MQSELKPCAKCGGEGKIVVSPFVGVEATMIYCKSCDHMTRSPHVHINVSIDEWNCRAPEGKEQ